MKKYLILIALLIFCIQITWIWTAHDNLSVSANSISNIPEFNLPSLDVDGIMISQKDLSYQGIHVINFFASWCGPCKVEHPFLMDLAERGIDILGIDFQDNPDLAKDFLKAQGSPYLLTAIDAMGELGPTWGINSIPQTYVINDAGQVLFHKSGRLIREDIENHINPLLLAIKE
ncbi:MAG: redoxin family protein [Kordiimonadaceae bacterium]|jgi:cytochrome c biogenesis protein CcmG, thiol:disulfide interchange protein DsbE|nr:redoxin family protein [Kordiimonadaceae bacterium]MBT6037237.1 redoxin family protein [Kordiimonadaceae bacterium]MBT6329809.1 redoxin family protein [Kordiimonadaceae bacterium]MBT7581693.1 redoxin family protein [Kordiimonadaceae bacterium]